MSNRQTRTKKSTPFWAFLIFLFIQVYVFNSLFRPPSQPLKSAGKCSNGLVYVYELPPMFNSDFLTNCHDLDPWHSRCNAVSNGGFGPSAAAALSHLIGDNLSTAWYWTDMFSGELIYHNRILNHPCRTLAPESASAFYIPFYAGIAVGKYLFTNYTSIQRDFHCGEILKWVQNQPPWRRSNGSDHFIMLGRMTWDFRRSNDDDWGSSFVNMPLIKRIRRLTVERDPWDTRELGVPYPTGFHPNSRSEIDEWQRFIYTYTRPKLFTFVGGRRPLKNDFRSILFDHCMNESSYCKLVDCSNNKCSDGTPDVLEAFLSSNFCLQPRGDAYTRRSTFDCMLAGSIPVFFWKRSIWNQYNLFLGEDPSEFSVLIDRKTVRNGTSVRKVLENYSFMEISRLRDKVISLIPKFVYSLNEGDYEDAFSVAIDGVMKSFKD